MHKYYDPLLFEVLSESEVLAEYAPKGVDGNPMDVNTAETLAAAGFDVRYVGPEDDERGAPDGAVADVGLVEGDAFARWLEMGGMALGTVVARWWVEQAPAAEGDLAAVRRSWDECAVDLFARIRDELVAEEKEELAAARARGGELDPERKVVDGALRVGALVAWLSRSIGDAFSFAGDTDEVMLADQVTFELGVVGERAGVAYSGGAMEGSAGGEDPERESVDIAERLVYGWPRWIEPRRLCGRRAVS